MHRPNEWLWLNKFSDNSKRKIRSKEGNKMTIKDTIAALPWYQRSAVDSLINQWDNENKLTRFLQGAGNKEEVEALIADFDNQDWTMFGGPGPKTVEEDPEPVQDEAEEPEVPETPAEETTPVEEEPEPRTETLTIVADVKLPSTKVAGGLK